MASRAARRTVAKAVSKADIPTIYRRIAEAAKRMNVTPSVIVTDALVDRYGWRAEWGLLSVHKGREFDENRISQYGLAKIPVPLYELVKKEAKVKRVPVNKLIGAITSAYLRRLESRSA
jgi:hypothetical protein